MARKSEIDRIEEERRAALEAAGIDPDTGNMKTMPALWEAITTIPSAADVAAQIGALPARAVKTAGWAADNFPTLAAIPMGAGAAVSAAMAQPDFGLEEKVARFADANLMPEAAMRVQRSAENMAATEGESTLARLAKGAVGKDAGLMGAVMAGGDAPDDILKEALLGRNDLNLTGNQTADSLIEMATDPGVLAIGLGALSKVGKLGKLGKALGGASKLLNATQPDEVLEAGIRGMKALTPEARQLRKAQEFARLAEEAHASGQDHLAREAKKKEIAAKLDVDPNSFEEIERDFNELFAMKSMEKPEFVPQAKVPTRDPKITEGWGQEPDPLDPDLRPTKEFSPDRFVRLEKDSPKTRPFRTVEERRLDDLMSQAESAEIETSQTGRPGDVESARKASEVLKSEEESRRIREEAELILGDAGYKPEFPSETSFDPEAIDAPGMRKPENTEPYGPSASEFAHSRRFDDFEGGYQPEWPNMTDQGKVHLKEVEDNAPVVWKDKMGLPDEEARADQSVGGTRARDPFPRKSKKGPPTRTPDHLPKEGEDEEHYWAMMVDDDARVFKNAEAKARSAIGHADRRITEAKAALQAAGRRVEALQKSRVGSSRKEKKRLRLKIEQAEAQRKKAEERVIAAEEAKRKSLPVIQKRYQQAKDRLDASRVAYEDLLEARRTTGNINANQPENADFSTLTRTQKTLGRIPAGSGKPVGWKLEEKLDNTPTDALEYEVQWRDLAIRALGEKGDEQRNTWAEMDRLERLWQDSRYADLSPEERKMRRIKSPIDGMPNLPSEADEVQSIEQIDAYISEMLQQIDRDSRFLKSGTRNGRLMLEEDKDALQDRLVSIAENLRIARESRKELEAGRKVSPSLWRKLVGGGKESKKGTAAQGQLFAYMNHTDKLRNELLARRGELGEPASRAPMGSEQAEFSYPGRLDKPIDPDAKTNRARHTAILREIESINRMLGGYGSDSRNPKAREAAIARREELRREADSLSKYAATPKVTKDKYDELLKGINARKAALPEGAPVPSEVREMEEELQKLGGHRRKGKGIQTDADRKKDRKDVHAEEAATILDEARDMVEGLNRRAHKAVSKADQHAARQAKRAEKQNAPFVVEPPAGMKRKQVDATSTGLDPEDDAKNPTFTLSNEDGEFTWTYAGLDESAEGAGRVPRFKRKTTIDGKTITLSLTRRELRDDIRMAYLELSEGKPWQEQAKAKARRQKHAEKVAAEERKSLRDRGLDISYNKKIDELEEERSLEKQLREQAEENATVAGAEMTEEFRFNERQRAIKEAEAIKQREARDLERRQKEVRWANAEASKRRREQADSGRPQQDAHVADMRAMQAEKQIEDLMDAHDASKGARKKAEGEAADAGFFADPEKGGLTPLPRGVDRAEFISWLRFRYQVTDPKRARLAAMRFENLSTSGRPLLVAGDDLRVVEVNEGMGRTSLYTFQPSSDPNTVNVTYTAHQDGEIVTSTSSTMKNEESAFARNLRLTVLDPKSGTTFKMHYSVDRDTAIGDRLPALYELDEDGFVQARVNWKDAAKHIETALDDAKTKGKMDMEAWALNSGNGGTPPAPPPAGNGPTPPQPPPPKAPDSSRSGSPATPPPTPAPKSAPPKGDDVDLDFDVEDDPILGPSKEEFLKHRKKVGILGDMVDKDAPTTDRVMAEKRAEPAPDLSGAKVTTPTLKWEDTDWDYPIDLPVDEAGRIKLDALKKEADEDARVAAALAHDALEDAAAALGGTPPGTPAGAARAAALPDMGADPERRWHAVGPFSSAQRYIGKVFDLMFPAQRAYTRDLKKVEELLDTAGKGIMKGTIEAKRSILYQGKYIDDAGNLTDKGKEINAKIALARSEGKDYPLLQEKYGAVTDQEKKLAATNRRIEEWIFKRVNEVNKASGLPEMPYRKDHVPFAFDSGTYDVLKQHKFMAENMSDEVKNFFERERRSELRAGELDAVDSMKFYYQSMLKKINFQPVVDRVIGEIGPDGKPTGKVKDWYGGKGDESRADYATKYMKMIVGGQPPSSADESLRALWQSLEQTSPKLFAVLGKPTARPISNLAMGLTNRIAVAYQGGNLGSWIKNLIGGYAFAVARLSGGERLAPATRKALGDGALAGAVEFGKNLIAPHFRVAIGALRTLGQRKYRTLARRSGVFDVYTDFLSEMRDANPKGVIGKIDNALMAGLNGVEFLNRGMAFTAGMSQYINRAGFSLSGKVPIPNEVMMGAVAYGQKVANDSQFVMGLVNASPVVGQGMGRVAMQYVGWQANAMGFGLDQMQKFAGAFGKDGNVNDAAGLVSLALTLGTLSYLLSTAEVDGGFLSDWVPGMGSPKGPQVPIGPGVQAIAKLFTGDASGAAKDFMKFMVPAHSAAKNAWSGLQIARQGGVSYEDQFKDLPERVWDALRRKEGYVVRHGVGMSKPLRAKEQLLMAIGLTPKRLTAERKLSEMREEASEGAGYDKINLKSRVERTMDATPKSARLDEDWWRTAEEAAGG